MYTYLRALSESCSSSLFMDADDFANTSGNQLIFLLEKRKTTLDIQTMRHIPNQAGLTTFIQSLNILSFQNEVVIDFGSLESRQILELGLNNPDFAPDCHALALHIHFHIIIAGGGNYQPCELYPAKISIPLIPGLSLRHGKTRELSGPSRNFLISSIKPAKA